MIAAGNEAEPPIGCSDEVNRVFPFSECWIFTCPRGDRVFLFDQYYIIIITCFPAAESYSFLRFTVTFTNRNRKFQLKLPNNTF